MLWFRENTLTISYRGSNKWVMEYSEKVLSGTGEVETDPNIVSEEAGKLYTELQVSSPWHYFWILVDLSHSAALLFKQAVIQTHGQGAVESVVPIFVWVLEGLASCKTQLRDKDLEVEQERAEREHLLERYQAERNLRKECQEVGSCVYICCHKEFISPWLFKLINMRLLI